MEEGRERGRMSVIAVEVETELEGLGEGVMEGGKEGARVIEASVEGGMGNLT